MIIKEEFLSKLRTYFSLNLYEAKIWAAILSRGVSTAGELSDIADIPRSRSYDILESLEKKGFVVMKMGKPIKYLAVPPEEVVERVKKNMAEDAKTKIKRLDGLKSSDAINELKALYKQGDELIEPSELSGSLKGRTNMYNHLDLMLKNANKSVTIMTTSQGLLRKLEGLKQTLEKIKKKGVSIRIAAPITKDSKELVTEMSNVAEIRHTEQDARFVIVDGKNITFMVLDDKEVHPTYDLGVWVNTPYFASAVERMFDQQWKNMKPAEQVLKRV